MNVMRYTVVDDRGSTSFVAPCGSLAALVAACAWNPRSLAEMLALATAFDDEIEERVLCGLAVFDEHNVDGNYQAINSALRYYAPHELPVFRVVDHATRQASLQPVKAGVVIFNLLARRIVQVQNTYEEIRRRGKILARDAFGRPRVQRYELPASWAIVP